MAKKKTLEGNNDQLREEQGKKIIVQFKTTYLKADAQKKYKRETIKKIERTFDLQAGIELATPSERKGNFDAEAYLKKNYQTLSKEEQVLAQFFTISCSSQTERDQLMEELKKDKTVESVSIDPIAETSMKPNDKKYPELWGIQKINPEKVWDCTQGCDVIVAVVDTGIDYNHKDLNHNMWESSPGVHGWNFTNHGASNDVMDRHSHGTHVAGTIAAEGNNKYGVIGVAPKARLMGMKGLNDYGSGAFSWLANCIQTAARLGAKVINNSWGSGRRNPARIPMMEAAINYAIAQGAVVVFAAGNSNDDAQFYYPQNSTKTLTVGATDQVDNRAGFSNYGSAVDVAAPGVAILSTTPGNNFASYSGTSMAAPHVSGMAALILSKMPDLDPATVQTIIESYIKSIAPDKPIGVGRIDLEKLEELLCQCKPTICSIKKVIANKELLQESKKKYKRIISKATQGSSICAQTEKLKTCVSCDFPELKPCFTLHWGDHNRDQIETHDSEKVFITARNPFNNISFKGLTITKIIIRPNQKLPNGADAIEIIPSKMICYDHLKTCQSITREYMLMTHYVIAGIYSLEFEYCIDEILLEKRKRHTDSFEIETIPS